MLQVGQGLLGIAQRAEIEAEHQEDETGLAEHLGLLGAVGKIQVHQDVREQFAGQGQGLLDSLGSHLVEFAEIMQRSQEMDAAVVTRDQALQHNPVHAGRVATQVGQAVERFQVEQDRQVSRRPFHVDQQNLEMFLSQDRGHVDRQGADAAPAVGTDHSDQLAQLPLGGPQSFQGRGQLPF